MDQLKNQLATALEVDPSDIMDYRKEPQKQPVEAAEDTYTVILNNYQKFTAVQPAIQYPKSEIPHGLQPIYENPMRGTKTQLLQLAEALDLDPGSKPTKKSLVKLIEASKKDQSAESQGGASTPQPSSAVQPSAPASKPGQSVPATDHMQAHDVTDWE